jgi:hypothetical protein
MVIAADGTPIYPRISRTTLLSTPYAASSSSSSSPNSSDLHLDSCAPYSSLVLNYPQPRPSPPPSWSPLPQQQQQHGTGKDDDAEMDVMHDFDAFETEVPCPPAAVGLPPSSFTVPARKSILGGSTGTLSSKTLLVGKGPQLRAQKQSHARKRDKMFKCPVRRIS